MSLSCPCIFWAMYIGIHVRVIKLGWGGYGGCSVAGGSYGRAYKTQRPCRREKPRWARRQGTCLRGKQGRNVRVCELHESCKL